MSSESAFIDALRGFASHSAARGLLDDAAVLEIGGQSLVLTKDMIVEGVHYRRDDPPEDVAWKLVAVNLSDLAAKAARPLAVLLGYSVRDPDWDRRFAGGLASALQAFAIELIGGDTVGGTGPRSLSLTAIGRAGGVVPSRSGAQVGDILWVSGTIGDAGAGLAILQEKLPSDEGLVRRYRRPQPRLEAGLELGPIVSAMMDVSDGLLIDAARMADASGTGITVDLDRLPLSEHHARIAGEGREARLRAATAGDDYELLFTAPADAAPRIRQLSERLGLPLSPIGGCAAGAGLSLLFEGARIPLPELLGWEHQSGGTPIA